MKRWEPRSTALLSFDLRRKADGVMKELMLDTGAPAHLSILVGQDVLLVHKLECADRALLYANGRADS